MRFAYQFLRMWQIHIPTKIKTSSIIKWNATRSVDVIHLFIFVFRFDNIVNPKTKIKL